MSDQPDEASPQEEKAGGDWRAEFAEEVPPPPDLIEALIAAVTADIEAAYTDAAVQFLAKLKQENAGLYLKLCAGLRECNELFSKTIMDEKVRRATACSIDVGEIEGAETAEEIAARLLKPAKLFVSPDGIAYADFRSVKGHRITSPVYGKAFRRWLIHKFFEATGKGPSGEVVTSSLHTCDARAHASGVVRDVFARVGHYAGRVYIDRGGADWSAIEIDAEGWRVVDEPPVRFTRSVGCAELPLPVAGGSIEQLRGFLNVDPAGFILCVGWLLGSINPHGPYAVLAMFGQHGSAKSTALRMLRALIDPNVAAMRTLPPTERDLLVGATRSWLQSFDNLSSLSPEMSDALCRLATGGGLVMRMLYTDGDEFLLTALRPICLNGIVEFITRPDLLDRSLLVTAAPLIKRLREKAVWAAFEAAQPAILGALYEAVSLALRNVDMAPAEDLPRMADFCEWVGRGEAAFGWAPGTFFAAYRQNIADSAQIAVEADLVASALLRFMHVADKNGAETSLRKESWTGTATKLLAELALLVGERQARHKDWPQSPNTLGRHLARVIPPLAQLGLRVTTDRSNAKRSVAMAWLPAKAAEAPGPAPEPPPEPLTEPNESKRIRIRIVP